MLNARICMGEERVRLTVQRTNKETKQIDVVEIEVTERDAAAANRALELLGKTEELRLFSDRSKDDHPDATVPLPPKKLREQQAPIILRNSPEGMAVALPWSRTAGQVRKGCPMTRGGIWRLTCHIPSPLCQLY